jgi:hypothetical protein
VLLTAKAIEQFKLHPFCSLLATENLRWEIISKISSSAPLMLARQLVGNAIAVAGQRVCEDHYKIA